MNRGTPPLRVYRRRRLLITTFHRSTLESPGFPVAWLQNTQKRADNSPVLDGGADDYKTVNSLVIAVAPLSVSCTHASTLLRT